MPPHFSEPSGIIIPVDFLPSTPYEGDRNRRLSDDQIRKAVVEVAKSPYDYSLIRNILSRTNDLLAKSVTEGIAWLEGIEQSNTGKFRKSIVAEVREIIKEKDGKQLTLHFGPQGTLS